MSRLWDDEDNVEPIADSLGEVWGAITAYNVTAGCALSYSAANMTVDLAGGSITHNNSPVLITAASAAFTVVSDPSNPRWTWLALSSAGAAVVISGDPAVAPSVPELGDRVPLALLLVQANQTIVANVTYKLDKRAVWPFVSRYKSTTQVFSANASLANVADTTGGAFSFYAAASSVWIVDYYIPLAFTGTGGAKFQISGPSAPTSVNISGSAQITFLDSLSDVVTSVRTITPVTAFASNIEARSAGTTENLYNNTLPSLVTLRLVLINGANAGLVTLQAAQNSANGTTTLGLGTTMVAQRISAVV